MYRRLCSALYVRYWRIPIKANLDSATAEYGTFTHCLFGWNKGINEAK